MPKRFHADKSAYADEWRNLRDDKGRLYGRVNRVKMLLEIRSHQQTMTFDLKELIELKAPTESESKQ